jgi:zinc protease
MALAATDMPRLSASVVEKTLPSGMKLIMLPNPKAPVITFQVWHRVGSRNEVLGRTGISHLMEHMMFKGTKDVGPEEFARIIQEHGGNNNAFTSKDFTAYFENMAAGEIETAIRLEADRARNLMLREEDFRTERMVVMEERRLRTEDNPQARLIEEVDGQAYMAHPYQWPTIGWANDLAKLTVIDVREYHQVFYLPNNSFIVVVGDFKPDEMAAMVEIHFGGIGSGPTPPEVRAVEPPQVGERSLTVKVPARLPTIAWAYHVPNLGKPDSISPGAYALEVLQAVLTAGDSSRMEMGLVRKGLAVDASAEYSLTSKDPGLFYLTAQVMPGQKPQEVERAMQRLVTQLQAKLVPPRELEKAKNQLEAAFIQAQDSLFYQGMLLATYEIWGDWREVDSYLPGIRAVNSEDVREAARRYLVPGNRTAGLLSPLPTAGKTIPPPAPAHPGGKVIQ